MITIRKSSTRGYAQHGWLESFHTFSFAEYSDPAYMGYSVLRVINEDKIAAGTGFGLHPHRDMEIITYMISGELRHQDSMGNGAVIRAGDVQYMSAGTGVRHSEINASSSHTAHLLQIWILPQYAGLTPHYAEQHFSSEQKRNRWCPIASPLVKETAIQIQQDVHLDAAMLEAGYNLQKKLLPNRCAYLQVVSGTLTCDGELLHAGDAAQIEQETVLDLQTTSGAELLWFDLPKEPSSKKA
ncbi:MAG TPA: pirin family protein [Methylotenera sp.]|nr:pirin family protein [Methylotenera sp.]HPH05242.1 pirin family protein [Methylotenera sp.]HPN00144.1 pirin family protein [Methylotenera sp.]